MNFHPEKLQSLLKIDLHDMIDHALGIQSLKVMRAYVRMLQEQCDLAHRLIQQQGIATSSIKTQYDKRLQDSHDSPASVDPSANLPEQPSDDLNKSIKWVAPVISFFSQKSPQEIVDDFYVQWQAEVKYLNTLTKVHDILNQRINVTQAIYDTLKTHDLPTLDNEILQSVYAYADLESARMEQVLQDLKSHITVISTHQIRWKFRLSRGLSDDNSSFAM